MKVEDVAIEHRVINEHHVFTSPDVPGLYVAHRDEDTARRSIQPAINMIEDMRVRRIRVSEEEVTAAAAQAVQNVLDNHGIEENTPEARRADERRRMRLVLEAAARARADSARK